ncbi:MAG: 50S ribosomal protein L18, partial [Candidatus Korarchaeota archaeon]|nr:50S ribosomal protein L18 [Candidatus Korarchaeota archaeon]
GIEIPHSPEVLPEEDRIKGEHIASWASSLKEESEEFYRRQFAIYLSREADPESMPEVFERVLSQLERGPSGGNG